MSYFGEKLLFDNKMRRIGRYQILQYQKDLKKWKVRHKFKKKFFNETNLRQRQKGTEDLCEHNHLLLSECYWWMLIFFFHIFRLSKFGLSPNKLTFNDSTRSGDKLMNVGRVFQQNSQTNLSLNEFIIKITVAENKTQSDQDHWASGNNQVIHLQSSLRM